MIPAACADTIRTGSARLRHAVGAERPEATEEELAIGSGEADFDARRTLVVTDGEHLAAALGLPRGSDDAAALATIGATTLWAGGVRYFEMDGIWQRHGRRPHDGARRTDDPTWLLDVLAASELTEVGPDSIGERACRHFAGPVELGGLADVRHPRRSFLSLRRERAIDVHVWIDERGQIARMSWTPSSRSERGAVRWLVTELYDYGTPAKRLELPSAPSRPRVAAQLARRYFRR